MEHVVFWSGHGGALEFARVPQLPEAVELVERLRNSDGITDATVHSLTDVPVAFRTYYVAEVGAGVPAVEATAAPIAPAVESVVDPAVESEPPSGDVPAASADTDVTRIGVEALDEAEATPVPEPPSHPALSVVPDMMDAPEPLPATEPADGTAAEKSSRSLGLFA